MAIMKGELAPGYTSEVDTVDEEQWCQILSKFDDANIYQTWSHAEVISGRRNMSHLILKQKGEVVAAAQVRIAKLPLINIGIAYVRWGPLWRRHATAQDVETFRQAIRTLRNEYACKRGLVLRLFPTLFENDSPDFNEVLTEEGFSLSKTQPRSRTILMDLSPSLLQLREGLGRNWKRSLRRAEEHNLEVIEGSGQELFKAVIDMYNETVSRKKFVAINDISQLALIQTRLPEELKMRALLCRSGDRICAGLIWSAIGTTAIELVAATSDIALKTNGSHLLRWKLVERLKLNCVATYNLNGINPQANPGTYRFKSELAGTNGRDVYFIGRFDSHDRALSEKCVTFADKLRTLYRRSRKRAPIAQLFSLGLWSET